MLIFFDVFLTDSSKLNKQSVLDCSITFQKQQNFESNAFF